MDWKKGNGRKGNEEKIGFGFNPFAATDDYSHRLRGAYYIRGVTIVIGYEALSIHDG